ncbi:MAG: hypothetical protein V8T85_04990 [Blautia faecicola]
MLKLYLGHQYLQRKFVVYLMVLQIFAFDYIGIHSKNLRICFPPLEEQRQIADFITAESKKLDALIHEKLELVVELEAYKKSLIYEVVTGKRRVV